jgi:endogenous inhibitor of DNA gyrase (YacG/DUF329 family)
VGVAQVLIECPVAKKPVATGWDLDWAGLEAAEMGEQILKKCPECGQEHRWTKNEAWLRADGGG